MQQLRGTRTEEKQQIWTMTTGQKKKDFEIHENINNKASGQVSSCYFIFVQYALASFKKCLFLKVRYSEILAGLRRTFILCFILLSRLRD